MNKNEIFMENRKKTVKEKVSIDILICHDTARGKELKRILISYVRTLIVVLALLAIAYFAGVMVFSRLVFLPNTSGCTV